MASSAHGRDLVGVLAGQRTMIRSEKDVLLSR